MEKTSIIHKYTNKSVPMTRLLLSIKLRVLNNKAIFLFLILRHFLGFFLLSTNFNTKDDQENDFSTSMRKLTAFGIIANNLSFKAYTVLSIFTFFFFGVFMTIFFNTIQNLKNKKDFIVQTQFKKRIYIINILFHIILFQSLHTLEFLSFIYVILFNKNESTYTLFNYLLTNSSDYFYGIIIFILNTMSIAFLNVFIYVSVKFLNEPFFDTDFPLQVKYNGFTYFFFMIITNLHGIHYVVLFLPDINIFKYIIFCSMSLLCITLFFRTFNNFNFTNFFNLLINFLTNFCFFSFIIEFILSLINTKIVNAEQIIYLVTCKILLSISFMILCHFIYNYYKTKQCSTKIFKQYNGKISDDDLESIYFFVNIVKSIKKGRMNEVEKILKIIISHKADCGLEHCKCNMITDYKIQNLSTNINILLETILSNINMGKNCSAVFLFAEYLHFLRKSTLFSYSVLNTYINKQIKNESHLILSNAYCLSFKRIIEYEKAIVTDREYPNYISAFDHYRRKKLYEELLNDIIDYFEQLVIFKERFDNTMKIEQNPDIKIDSYIFKESIDPLVSNCKTYKDLYKKLKTQISEDFSVSKCKEIELSYKLYVFFKIFNGSIPKSILNMICLDTEYDVSSSHGVQKYFNKYFEKFFNKDNEDLSIIMEIHNLFKVVYFNNKLSDALEVPLTKLIGFDIHQLIPLQLRTPHKRNLTNHYLLKKNAYFRLRTFAFTSSHILISAKFNHAPLPNLTKNLQYIMNVNLFEMDKHQYIFFLSENFDLIALSGSLDSKYSISFEMLDKFNINIIKLLDLEEEMKIRFKSCYNNMEVSKKEKTLGGLYYLSYYLFNLNLDDEANESPIDANQEINDVPIKVSGISNSIFDSKPAFSSIQNTIKKNHLEKLITYSTETKSARNKTAGPLANSVVQLNSYKQFKKKSRVAISERTESKPILKLNNFVDKDSIANFTNRKSIKKSISPISRDSIIHMNNLHKKKDDSPPEWDDYFSNNKSNGNSFGDTMFSVTREKKDIIGFLEKLYNKSLDVEIKLEMFEKLKTSIGLLKDSTTKHTDEFDYYKSTSNQIITSDSFKLKVYFRKINDTPFYVISLKEKFILKNIKKPVPVSKFKRDLTQVNEKCEDSRESTMIEELNLKQKKIKYEINIIAPDENFDNKPKKSKNNIILDKVVKDTHKINRMSIAFPEKIPRNHPSNDKVNLKLKNYTKDKLILYKKFEKNSQKKMKVRENRFTCLLWVFLLLNITISCIVFYLKLFSVESVYSLFHINYHSIGLVNSVSLLESAIISLGLILTKLTEFNNSENYEITAKTIQDIIDNRQKKLRNSFSSLLNAIDTSKFDVTFINNILFDTNLTYSTTMLTWDNIQNKDSLDGIIDYMCSSANELSLRPDLTTLTEDIYNSLLFYQFAKQNGELQQSNDSGIYYFIINNFNNLKNIFDNLTRSIELTLEYIKNLWLKITLIVEILNIIISIILVILIYFILNRYDSSIFNTLILAFLNMRTGFDFKYQSEAELIKIKNQIKIFRQIATTFTRETIKLCDDNLRSDIFERKDNSYLEELSKRSAALELSGRKDKSNKMLDTVVKTTDANLNTSNYKTTTSNLINNTLNNSSLAFLNINMPQPNKKNSDNSLEVSNDSKKNTNKKNSEKETTPTEEDQIITNGQILKYTKHYPINLIKIAKILIAMIFSVYIIFVIASLITNNTYLNGLDNQYMTVNTLAIKLPSITKYFNIIRLMIMENNMTFQENYLDVLRNYTAGDVVKINEDLTETQIFEDKLNKEIKNINVDDICLEPFQSLICKQILMSDKGYNQKGIRLGAKSVVQSLSNIMKDYNNLHSNGKSDLSSTEIIKKYFNNGDFVNINLDIEFVFNSVEFGYLNYIDIDMDNNFAKLTKVIYVFGIISIVLNLIIIFYVIFGFFNRIKFIMDYILYTTKKFNKVMYD